MLARWGADGSDEYVRTYKAAVKNLVAKFVDTVPSGESFKDFDEEDTCQDIKEMLIRKGTDNEFAAAFSTAFGAQGQICC